MQEPTVTISINELRGLIRNSQNYEALEAAGVDNWEGLDYVDWPTDEEVDEELEELVDKQ